MSKLHYGRLKKKIFLVMKNKKYLVEVIPIYKIPHPSPCMSKDVQRLCVGQVRPKGSTSCT